MNKIINGKRYDTETAKALAFDSYSNPSDFNYWSETLYQKRTGEFFLHGEGGAMSKYAESAGQNEWSGGEEIIPLSVDSAQEWAEEHLSADEYEDIFGETSEDGSKHGVLISMTANTEKLLLRLAAEEGCSKSDLVERAIRFYADK